jgi:hypothetical protein
VQTESLVGDTRLGCGRVDPGFSFGLVSFVLRAEAGQSRCGGRVVVVVRSLDVAVREANFEFVRLREIVGARVDVADVGDASEGEEVMGVGTDDASYSGCDARHPTREGGQEEGGRLKFTNSTTMVQ